MRLEDYMYDINTRSLDSMHKFTYAMISHTADLFNFRYLFKNRFLFCIIDNCSKKFFFKCTCFGDNLLGPS